MDLGYEKAKEVLLSIVVPYINDENVLFFSDYKSKLQEIVQDMQKLVEYEVIDEKGPAHDKKFKVIVKIEDIVYGEGEGHTKKEAEQEAAKSALKKLVKNN